MLNMFFYKLKFRIRKFFRYLTTHKCEAKGCTSRLDKPYRWCSFECFVYCGGKLKPEPKKLDIKSNYFCVFCGKEHLCDIVKTKHGEDLVCPKTKQRVAWRIKKCTK